MKNKIIIVAGPTASGKTALGIELAKRFNGEIICADSMQVYKDMPIATAAPTKEEKAQAKHHLTQFLSMEESFSVVQWCSLAKAKVQEILSENKLPIIVGGTGLFIDSFVDNIQFNEADIDYDLRSRLMQTDSESLYNELMSVDPEAAGNIHINNKKRVVRALEIYYSGSTKTQQNLNSKKEESPYDFLYLVLDYNDRQTLYGRINSRVDKMLENGLVQESERVLEKSSGTGAQAIGAKELAPYFRGELELSEAAENLKKETRHYAKRQMTWFRKRGDAVRVVMDDALLNPVDFASDKCEEFLYG